MMMDLICCRNARIFQRKIGFKLSILELSVHKRSRRTESGEVNGLYRRFQWTMHFILTFNTCGVKFGPNISQLEMLKFSSVLTLST